MCSAGLLPQHSKDDVALACTMPLMPDTVIAERCWHFEICSTDSKP